LIFCDWEKSVFINIAILTIPSIFTNLHPRHLGWFCFFKWFSYGSKSGVSNPYQMNRTLGSFVISAFLVAKPIDYSIDLIFKVT